jgi:hypothetical protein
MELEYIFLAKFAELGAEGLFTVVGGGLNRINAQSLPWSWGVLFLLAQIRITPDEAKKGHVIAIERESPSGQIEAVCAVPMVQFPSNMLTGPDGKLGLNFNQCIVGSIFYEAGVYKYRLKIDGQEMGAAQLLVAGPL